jgi:hypothetical protein
MTAQALIAAVVGAAVAVTCAVASAATPPPRPFVHFDITADLTAGDAGSDVAGSSSINYRCDAEIIRLSDRIWFERRSETGAAWRRIEPAGVAYRSVRLPDRRASDALIRRSTVRAPRAAFAGAGTVQYRLRSRMVFTCGDQRAVAKWKTLPLQGLQT